MNRQKLIRRTAHAQVIRDRHNPPYRVYDANRDQFFSARTREQARDFKRSIAASGGLGYIERRVDNGTGGVTYVRQ